MLLLLVIKEFNMNNILYIYGYGSSPKSSTYQWLKHNLVNDNVYCEEYDQGNPDISVSHLCKVVLEKNINIIIGSSFGGWYALHVAGRTGRKCILINPLTDKNLKEVLGNTCQCHYIENILKFQNQHPLFESNENTFELWDTIDNGCFTWVILGKADEVIPFQIQDIQKYVKHVVEIPDGNHHLSDEEKDKYINYCIDKLV